MSDEQFWTRPVRLWFLRLTSIRTEGQECTRSWSMPCIRLLSLIFPTIDFKSKGMRLCGRTDHSKNLCVRYERINSYFLFHKFRKFIDLGWISAFPSVQREFSEPLQVLAPFHSNYIFHSKLLSKMLLPPSSFRFDFALAIDVENLFIEFVYYLLFRGASEINSISSLTQCSLYRLGEYARLEWLRILIAYLQRENNI